MSRTRLWALALLVEGGCLALAWAGGALVGVRVFAPPTLSDALWGLLGSVPPLLALGAFLRARGGRAAAFRRGVLDRLAPLFARCTTADLLVISLLAGVGEEALFRGLLQGALQGWLGPLPALLLGAVAFGAAHAISPVYALYAAAMGAYLGGLYLLAGSIWAPALVHALYDALALLWLRTAGGSSSNLPRPAAGG